MIFGEIIPTVCMFVCVIPGERIPWEDYPPVLSSCAPDISGKRVLPLLRYKIISWVSRPSCTRPLRACDNSQGQRVGVWRKEKDKAEEDII